MDIFFSLNSVNQTPDIIRNAGMQLPDICQNIFQQISDLYDDQCEGKESYISQNCDAMDCILFGVNEPARILERMGRWNQEIQERFFACLKSILPDQRGPYSSVWSSLNALTPDQVPMDNVSTWHLSCAARELDNHWFDYANHAVLTENDFGFSYFKVILNDRIKLHIQKHPEEYAIIQVFPK